MATQRKPRFHGLFIGVDRYAAVKPAGPCDEKGAVTFAVPDGQANGVVIFESRRTEVDRAPQP